MATPWEVVADPGESGTRPLDLPKVGGGGFDEATPPSATAKNLPSVVCFLLAYLDRRRPCAHAQPLCPREVDDAGWRNLRQGTIGLMEPAERTPGVLQLRGRRRQRGLELPDRHWGHHVWSREVADHLDLPRGRHLPGPRPEQLGRERPSWELPIRGRDPDHATVLHSAPRSPYHGDIGTRRPRYRAGCQPAPGNIHTTVHDGTADQPGVAVRIHEVAADSLRTGSEMGSHAVYSCPAQETCTNYAEFRQDAMKTDLLDWLRASCVVRSRTAAHLRLTHALNKKAFPDRLGHHHSRAARRLAANRPGSARATCRWCSIHDHPH